MPGFHELLFSVEAGAFAVVSLSLAYLVFALSRIMAFRAQHPPAGSDTPGITVLKPIHGLDVELEQNLCSFFSQDYPGFQIVFAVASPSDAAIPVVKRVMAAFPHRDSTLVIDDHALGTNRKISNVHNAYAVAKHDILVIADSDFGLSVPVNEAIEAAFQRGILTAASLMVGGPAAGDAIARAQRLRGLKVGLHVVLVCGRPVLPPADVPDLVNQDGEFSTNLVLAGVKYFFSRAVRRQLEAEIRAQFEVFRATGLELDHVNAHNHMQLHPTVCALILQVGREYGLRAMRVPYEPLLCAWRASHDRLGQRLGSWALLGAWAVLMTSGLRRAHIASNDYLFGIQDTGQMTADRVLAFIARLPDGVSELYFHPSVHGPPGTPWPAQYACEDELAALISPAVAAALRAADIQRISYSDLIAH